MNTPARAEFTPATAAIIMLNATALLMATTLGETILVPLALWPAGPLFLPWQVVTYSFLHANVAHLVFNMLGVYTFGTDLERSWGSRRFLLYYFMCVLAAALTQLLVAGVTGARGAMVGASGAVFGLLLAYARMYPDRIVVLLVPPIPMRAPVFTLIFGALELVLGVSGTGRGVAHFAHLGGMAGGYLLLRHWRRAGTE